MTEKLVRLGPNGRIVIPVHYRKELGLEPGDRLIVVLDQGTLRLLTPRQAVERAQELVSRYVRKGRRLSKELLEERKQETRRG